MANAQKITKKLIKSLESVGEMIDSSDIALIFQILDKYDKIPYKLKNINLLQKELKKRFPEIFKKQLIPESNEFTLQDIKIRKKVKLSNSRHHQLDAINNFLTKNQGEIVNLRKKLKTLFPSSDHIHSFRIKDYKSLLVNIEKYDGIRATMDVVGFRVVPKSASKLPMMVKKIEQVLKNKIAFKLSTINYDEKEIKKKLGVFSIYYRAIHYYFKLDDFYIELQIRTPGVDQWSVLHHSTVYKPKIKISNLVREDIMQFGKISNIVDYYELLNS